MNYIDYSGSIYNHVWHVTYSFYLNAQIAFCLSLMSIRTNSRVRTTMKSFLDAIPHKLRRMKVVWHFMEEREWTFHGRNVIFSGRSRLWTFVLFRPRSIKSFRKRCKGEKRGIEREREREICWKFDATMKELTLWRVTFLELEIRNQRIENLQSFFPSLIIFLILLLIWNRWYRYSDIYQLWMQVFVNLFKHMDCQ